MSYEVMVRQGRFAPMGATEVGGSGNVFERFLRKPSTRDPDVNGVAQTFAKVLYPIIYAPVKILPISEKDKDRIYKDPLSIIFDLIQNHRQFWADVINRVAKRSGKSTRTIGSVVVPMTATTSQSIFLTVAQFLMLLSTEWFAYHDEIIRTATGQGIGQRGFLGVEPVTLSAALVALGVPAAEAVAIEATLTAFAVTASAVGALAPVVTTLVNLAKGDEAQAKSKAAAISTKTVTSTVKSPTGASATGGGGSVTSTTKSSSNDGLLLGVAALGALALFLKGR